MNSSTFPFGNPGLMHAMLACTWLGFLAMYLWGCRLNNHERTKAAEQVAHAQHMMALEEKRKASSPFQGPK